MLLGTYATVATMLKNILNDRDHTHRQMSCLSARSRSTTREIAVTISAGRMLMEIRTRDKSSLRTLSRLKSRNGKDRCDDLIEDAPEH